MVTCCHSSFGSMATRMFRVENSGLALGPVQRYHQCHVRTDKSRISESDEAKKATLCCMHASLTAWTWLQSRLPLITQSQAGCHCNAQSRWHSSRAEAGNMIWLAFNTVTTSKAMESAERQPTPERDLVQRLVCSGQLCGQPGQTRLPWRHDQAWEAAGCPPPCECSQLSPP